MAYSDMPPIDGVDICAYAEAQATLGLLPTDQHREICRFCQRRMRITDAVLLCADPLPETEVDRFQPEMVETLDANARSRSLEERRFYAALAANPALERKFAHAVADYDLARIEIPNGALERLRRKLSGQPVAGRVPALRFVVRAVRRMSDARDAAAGAIQLCVEQAGRLLPSQPMFALDQAGLAARDVVAPADRKTTEALKTESNDPRLSATGTLRALAFPRSGRPFEVTALIAQATATTETVIRVERTRAFLGGAPQAARVSVFAPDSMEPEQVAVLEADQPLLVIRISRPVDRLGSLEIDDVAN